MSVPSPSPRQAKVIWFALTALAVALTVAIVGSLFWALGRFILLLSPVLWPIAVAGVLAIIMNPVVEWLTARRVPRLRAILLVFVGAAVMVLGVVGSLVPRAVVEAQDLARRIPGYVATARERAGNFIDNPPASLRRFLPAGWLAESKVGAEGREAMVGTNAVREVFGSESITNTASGVGTNVPPVGQRGGEESAWWLKAVDPKALKTAGDWLATLVPEVGGWILGQVGRVASWFGVIAGLALIPIYAFYFLLEKSSIERSWTDYLPVSDSRFKDELVWLLRNINDALVVFFRGQVLVAICDGVLYTAGFLAIGLPYALLLGLMATVLTIVPFLGAIVTCASALVIAIVQFGDWQHPLLVLGVFAVVQTVEGWLIQPKIIGDRVGLHPVTIIIALLVGTTLLGGILGGILAIPATAVIRALMFRYIWRKRGENGERRGASGQVAA